MSPSKPIHQSACENDEFNKDSSSKAENLCKQTHENEVETKL